MVQVKLTVQQRERLAVQREAVLEIHLRTALHQRRQRLPIQRVFKLAAEPHGFQPRQVLHHIRRRDKLCGARPAQVEAFRLQPHRLPQKLTGVYYMHIRQRFGNGGRALRRKPRAAEVQLFKRREVSRKPRRELYVVRAYHAEGQALRRIVRRRAVGEGHGVYHLDVRMRRLPCNYLVIAFASAQIRALQRRKLVQLCRLARLQDKADLRFLHGHILVLKIHARRAAAQCKAHGARQRRDMQFSLPPGRKHSQCPPYIHKFIMLGMLFCSSISKRAGKNNRGRQNCS